MFNIYVDADSFPRELVQIVLKRAVKEYKAIGEIIFVSDRVIAEVRNTSEHHTALLREGIVDKEERRKVKSNIKYIVVEQGANSADDKIVEIATLPSFAITHDIPLAFRLVEKGLTVLDDRGNIYTEENIRERKSERDFFTELREYGFESNKTKKIDSKTIKLFSAAFDSTFNKYKESNP